MASKTAYLTINFIKMPHHEIVVNRKGKHIKRNSKSKTVVQQEVAITDSLKQALQAEVAYDLIAREFLHNNSSNKKQMQDFIEKYLFLYAREIAQFVSQQAPSN